MNKNNIYCYKCNKNLDINDNMIIFNCDCYPNKTYAYFLEYCDICKKFTCRRGNKYHNNCISCKTEKIKKTGIFDREDFGFKNKEIHRKTIETQIKNGTGVAGDKEARKKSRESFIKNRPFDRKDWGLKNKKIYSKTIKNRENNALKNGFSSYAEYQSSITGFLIGKKENSDFLDFSYNCDCNHNCPIYNNCCNKNVLKNKWGWCQNNPNINKNINYITFKEMKEFTIENCDCNKNCLNYNTCNNKNVLKNKWGWCQSSPNIISFNREYFYSGKFHVTNYESVEEMIDDFNSLLGVSGVWTVKCNGKVLDVCETKDIGKEMYQTIRRLSVMKGKTDEELCNMNNSYNRRKVRDIANEGKLDFVLIARDIEDKEERQKIEAQYAYDNKAKYWSPAPGQIMEVVNETR